MRTPAGDVPPCGRFLTETADLSGDPSVTPVEVTVDVDRPPEEVFAYVADFENNPAWQSGVETARFTADGPLGVGSTYVQEAGFLGRRIESTFEVTAFEPGTMVRIESVAGTFPIQVTRRVDPIEGGSRVTATVEGEPDGVFRLAAPLVTPLMRRRIEGDYRRLKALLESATIESDGSG